MKAFRRISRLVALVVAVGSLLCWGLVSSPGAGAAVGSDGYWLLTGDGGVFNFGVPFHGAPASDPTRCAVAPLAGRAPRAGGTCTSMAVTAGGGGYWILNAITGAIYPYGTARNFGEPKTKFAHASPEFMPDFAQIVPTPDSLGYWVYEVGASGAGTVDHFGDAGFFGDTATLAQTGRGYNGLPVALATTANGKGYWEVFSDGGVFAFGNARFAGSMAGQRLASPIVGAMATASGKGYILAAGDGGVFAFGDARFAGSMADKVHKPIVGITRNPAGPGYWLASNNGQIFAFGGAPFGGTLAMYNVHGHVVTAIASRSGH